MGVLIGLLLGLGLFLVLASGRETRPRTGPSWSDRREDLLLQAGIEGVSPSQLLGLQVAAAVIAFFVVLVLSRALPIAACFALFGALAPVGVVRRYRVKRSTELRDVWPEVVDNLTSAVRAGLSLPEALSVLGTRGPEALRSPFLRFADDYRATGRFGQSLDRLKATLADPVGDRIVESLRMAREVGGTDLGRLLRTLSAFLREDARARAELETRQSWTINAARIAVAAPWAVLLLLATQPATTQAYNSLAGTLVLAIGGATTLVAYRLMVRIGRLPEERRVLR